MIEELKEQFNRFMDGFRYKKNSFSYENEFYTVR